eukprot:jgi/Bigna1/126883/aug1.3_g1591
MSDLFGDLDIGANGGKNVTEERWGGDENYCELLREIDDEEEDINPAIATDGRESDQNSTWKPSEEGGSAAKRRKTMGDNGGNNNNNTYNNGQEQQEEDDNNNGDMFIPGVTPIFVKLDPRKVARAHGGKEMEPYLAPGQKPVLYNEPWEVTDEQDTDKGLLTTEEGDGDDGEGTHSKRGSGPPYRGEVKSTMFKCRMDVQPPNGLRRSRAFLDGFVMIMGIQFVTPVTRPWSSEECNEGGEGAAGGEMGDEDDTALSREKLDRYTLDIKLMLLNRFLEIADPPRKGEALAMLQQKRLSVIMKELEVKYGCEPMEVLFRSADMIRQKLNEEPFPEEEWDEDLVLWVEKRCGVKFERPKYWIQKATRGRRKTRGYFARFKEYQTKSDARRWRNRMKPKQE